MKLKDKPLGRAEANSKPGANTGLELEEVVYVVASNSSVVEEESLVRRNNAPQTTIGP
jgi:hypothetical protein